MYTLQNRTNSTKKINPLEKPIFSPAPWIFLVGGIKIHKLIGWEKANTVRDTCTSRGRARAICQTKTLLLRQRKLSLLETHAPLQAVHFPLCKQTFTSVAYQSGWFPPQINTAIQTNQGHWRFFFLSSSSLLHFSLFFIHLNLRMSSLPRLHGHGPGRFQSTQSQRSAQPNHFVAQTFGQAYRLPLSLVRHRHVSVCVWGVIYKQIFYDPAQV